MSKTAKKFALGTIIAAAFGYLAGILTAPKSGRQTRQDIQDTTMRGIAEAERQLKKLHTELGDLIQQAKDQADAFKGKAKEDLDQAIDMTRIAKEKTREMLSAVHEGDANDKDLKKAIAEANKAIDHLRAYLMK